MTVDVPDAVGSATLVAVTVTVCAELIEAGAVYSPVPLMLPVPDGLIDHVTDVFDALVTVAVNCCVSDAERVAVVGETLTDTPPDEPDDNVTVALAEAVASSTLVAVTVIVCGDVIVAGAVYTPRPLMLPTPAGVIDQRTALLRSLATVAVNVWIWDWPRVAAAGVTLTEIGGDSHTEADAA